MRTFFLLLATLCGCSGQTLIIQNLTGAQFQDGVTLNSPAYPDPYASSFNFPVGATIIPITPDVVAGWNGDALGTGMIGPIDNLNDWMVYLVPGTPSSTISGYADSYPIGTLSSSVNVGGINTNSIAMGVMEAASDSSVLTAFQGGLGLGATVVATLFCFTFMRAIPGGNTEDM